MAAIINKTGASSADQKNQKLGTVRIARGVLETIVQATTLNITGVVRMGNPSSSRNRFFGRDHGDGVKTEVHEDKVFVELYVVVDKNQNIAEVGKQIQNEVSRAIRSIVGMAVEEINVYIQNVE